ncbi:MAG: NIPSNAP family protein [Deinococcaceae bacterium]
MKRLIEIRSYKLKPATGDQFYRLVAQESVPLQRAFGMDVVAFGPSLHDADVYVLIRAYRDLSHLESSQEAFYGTESWRKGPREAILELIQSDANVVMWLANEVVESMRDSLGQSG